MWRRVSGRQMEDYFHAISSPACTYADIKAAIKRAAKEKGWTI